MGEWQEEADIPEVLQMEPDDIPTVPVSIVGPVRTQQMPAQAAGGKSYLVADTDTIQVLRPDPYRARATLISIAHPFAFAPTQAELAGRPPVWPAAVPLVMSAVETIWVQCATAGQTDTISVIQERWAD